MHISYAVSNEGSDNPEWYLLAEFPLNEFLSDLDRRDTIARGLLFQAVRHLDMPLECVKKMEMSLAEFAKEALTHFRRASESSGQVRVFCQRKIIDEENAGRAASQSYPAGQAIEFPPGIFDPDLKMNGGWGFFLLERGGKLSPGFSVSPSYSLDLYLYKEGE